MELAMHGRAVTLQCHPFHKQGVPSRLVLLLSNARRVLVPGQDHVGDVL
jgi:hypothetical protein